MQAAAAVGTQRLLRPRRPWTGLARYLGLRVLVLLLTAVVGVYVTIIAANLGGHVDEIMRSMIIESVGIGLGSDPEIRQLPMAQREVVIAEAIAAAEEAAGLTDPFLLRTLRWLRRGITLDLGSSVRLRSLYATGGDRNSIRLLIGERLPLTLLLFGITNLISVLLSLLIAPRLARKHDSPLDRLFVALSPLSSAPSWFHGVFLIAIFAAQLRLLPFGGILPSPPPESRWLYALGVLRHSVLPAAAIFVSTFFQSVYMWRTLFLVHAREDYVEMAKAKGLPHAQLERQHIIRPTLPPILTNVALVVLSAWAGSVMLETLFSLPGLGQLFFLALRRFDTPVIVGITVVYAYMLVTTVLVLDIAYAFVDPRVRVKAPSTPRLRLARSGLRWTARPSQPIRQLPRRLADTTHLTLERLKSLRARARRDHAWPRNRARSQGSILGNAWREMRRYPSAIVGLAIILVMLASIVYTVIALPLDHAIAHWRGDLDVGLYPRNARPIWVNLFTRARLPSSMSLSTLDGTARKELTAEGDREEIVATFTFDYRYDAFPQELAIDFYTQYRETPPHASMTWRTPDGREIRIGQAIALNHHVYRFAYDSRLVRRLGGVPPHEALFADPAQPTAAQRGTYELEIRGLLFEDEGDLDARFVLHGQVHGLAGTDHRRRDLSVALLWGVPTAMGFGLAAALCTTLATMLIAGVSAWYGGWVDGIIQRVTEVNLILPVFPILAMITVFHTTRIFHILIAAVLLGIFGSGIKNYRAMFLQMKEEPYIEAARAYGAGDVRIVLRYLTPRILPLLIPQMVTLVPSYVFLEASLAFLGLSDPLLPTWGKVINDAHLGNALSYGQAYWMLQPAVLLLLTSLAFAMIGGALDRILNPKLRDL